MTAFLLLGEYLAPLDVLDAVRPVHREWLDTVAAAGRLVLAGRKLSQDGSSSSCSPSRSTTRS